jgi:ribosomal protein L11 methyltransferase
MKRQYHIYQFTTKNSTEQEMLIARLMDIGFDGVVEQEEGFMASIQTTELDTVAFDAVLEAIPASFTRETEEEQNWNSRWEQDFTPVQVDDFAMVRAAFHPIPADVQYDITITPKMSFGTGHHATTYMMIQQMRDLDIAGKKVFDFGTGTGVLAILAQKMGAAVVTAIDNDDWSIQNAKENFDVNACTAITLHLADKPVTGNFDMILANINLNVLRDHMAALAGLLPTGGVLLLSGILNSDEAEMQELLIAQGLQTKKILQRDNWSCMATVRGIVEN